MKARAAGLKPGDKVSWKTTRGQTTGTVKKKLTSTSRIKSHKISATKENPQYLVQSSKSGKPAAHKKSALKKVKA